MKAMKFKVKNEEHSKKIQERLFELGYAWRGTVKEVRNTEDPYLYANDNTTICRGSGGDLYYKDPNEETTLEELYKTNNEKHKTMESMQFKIHNPEHSKAIQERLFELGFRWENRGKNVYYTDSPILTARLNPDDGYKIVCHSSRVVDGLVVATLDDLYNVEKEKPIKIDEFIVEFKENGIKVGCQHVSKGQIKRVLNRLEKGENEISFKNMVLKVSNPKHSEAIQKRLFELGYEWKSSKKNVSFEHGPTIYADKNGYIYTFVEGDKQGYKQTTLDQLYDMEENDLFVIDNAPVEFKEDGIKCQNRFVPKETIEKIYERLSGC